MNITGKLEIPKAVEIRRRQSFLRGGYEIRWVDDDNEDGYAPWQPLSKFGLAYGDVAVVNLTVKVTS